MEHRLVSLLPLSHSLEQAVSLFYAMDVGADILYVRVAQPAGHLRQPPRAPGHDDAPRPPGARPVLERDRARGREAGPDARRSNACAASPAASPTGRDASCSGNVHKQLGGGLRLFATAGAFLPPALQQAWEDMGVIVLQGYGATETAAGSATTMADHPLGCVGWPPPPVEMRMADDGEIQFRGPTLFKGYWHNPEATAAAFTDDGWYKSGDLGQLDAKGRLHLHGRKKDIIVLPNGFNVYPEDIENALRVAGVRDSVALETRARADRGDRARAGRRTGRERRTRRRPS